MNSVDDLPENIMEVMSNALVAAKRRVQAEYLVRSQMTILPNPEDFIVASQKVGLDPNVIDAEVLSSIFIDLALPRSWEDRSLLFTSVPARAVEHAVNNHIVLRDGSDMYPVIQLSEYDVTVQHQPKITWQRGTTQHSNKPWPVDLLYTHMLAETGMVFVELRTPTEFQEQRRGNVQYEACVVGFCIAEASFLQERPQ